MPKFEITTLKREELDILLEMIKEFAQYEEMEDFYNVQKKNLKLLYLIINLPEHFYLKKMKIS